MTTLIFTSNGNVSSVRKCLDSLIRVENNNKVGNVRSNLNSPSDTTRRDERRSRPGPIRQPRDDKTRPSPAREDEACFPNGEHGETFGVEKDSWSDRRQSRRSNGEIHPFCQLSHILGIGQSHVCVDADEPLGIATDVVFQFIFQQRG